MKRPDFLRFRGPYPLLLSLAALVVSGLITLFVLAPELHILGVASFRAAFVWFTWYGDVFHWAGQFLPVAPWIPVPFVLVAVMLVLRRLVVAVVRRWRPPVRSGGRPLWVRAIQVVVGLPLLASGLGLAVLLLVPALSHGSGYFLTPGGSLQRDRCSKCHSPYRPFHFIKTKELWKTTVSRMRRLEGAPIDDQQEARIVSYLQSHAALSDSWIFRAKCLRCHDRGTITAHPRSAEEWRLLMGRVSRISPYAFRKDWRRQLERYAGQELATVPPASGTAGAKQLQAKLAFERVCGHCHELSLALAADAKEPAALVRRMVRKVPSLATEGDVGLIHGFLRQRPTEAKKLKSLFPHDAKVWPTW